MRKATPKQKPSPEQKYAVVLQVLQKEKSLAAICSDEHISLMTALKWVEQFLTNGR